MPTTVGAVLFAACRQKLVPELQPLINRNNSAESTTLMTMEPRQPNRFEKKKNN